MWVCVQKRRSAASCSLSSTLFACSCLERPLYLCLTLAAGDAGCDYSAACITRFLANHCAADAPQQVRRYSNTGDHKVVLCEICTHEVCRANRSCFPSWLKGAAISTHRAHNRLPQADIYTPPLSTVPKCFHIIAHLHIHTVLYLSFVVLCNGGHTSPASCAGSSQGASVGPHPISVKKLRHWP